MRYRWMSTVLVIALASFSAVGADDASPVVVGTKHACDSKVLREKRDYLVHLPRDYGSSSERYPVLVLLDGESHFVHTSGTADYLADNGRIPRMIVIGIPNTERARDMALPMVPIGDPAGRPEGSTRFLSFIADELLPHVDATYRTQQYRVIVGHSMGGAFAISALAMRPDVFDAYLAISPSIWGDEAGVIPALQKTLEQRRDLRVDVFATLGDERGHMLGGFWRLGAALGEANAPNLRWQIHRWTDESHGSVPLRSTLEGLQAIYAGYYVQDALAAYQERGLTGLLEQFDAVSARLGYEVPVPRDVFDTLVSFLPMVNPKADVEPIAIRALRSHPDLAEAHVALGRIYAARGDNARAVESLSKALEIFPGNETARAALAQLNVDPQKIVPELKLTPAELRAYVGVYRADTGQTSVRFEDGKLYATSEFGRRELRPIADDKFYCVGWDAEMAFKRNPAGRITSLVVQEATSSHERKKAE